MENRVVARALDPASPSSPDGPTSHSPEARIDADDVRAAADGDSSAFDRLVLRHQQAVIDSAHYFLGNYEDALEVAQEAFVKAYRALASFRGEARFRTWILRITTNAARSFHTRRSAKKRSAPTVPIHGSSDDANADAGAGIGGAGGVDVPDYGDTPDERLARREVKEALEAAILSLDPEARELVVLRDISGEPYEAIADQFDMPLGTVKSKVHRARLLLRDKMTRFL